MYKLWIEMLQTRCRLGSSSYAFVIALNKQLTYCAFNQCSLDTSQNVTDYR